MTTLARGTRIALLLAAIALPLVAGAAPKKPPPPPPRKPPPSATPSPAETKPAETKPTETKPAETKPTETKPAETKPTETPDAGPTAPTDTRVELGVCPGEANLQTTGEALVALLHKDCHPLLEGDTAELSEGGLVVALCVRAGKAVAPKECGLRATLEPVLGGAAPLALAADGDLAISLKASRLAEQSPRNGAAYALVSTTTLTPPAVTSLHARVLWRKPWQAYGSGWYVWFPLPMLTSDFSLSAGGYRAGISPVAIAFGTRYYPSSSSRGYIGASLFGAWNVLIPNDTLALSDTTEVRINYRAAGGGLLFDAAGFVALGAGVGRTFTKDSRTDFRMWLYFGPRLLGFTNDF